MPTSAKRLLRIILVLLTVTNSVPESKGIADDKSSTPTADHQDLLYYQDAEGRNKTVTTVAEWEIRRRSIIAGMEQVMGDLPGRARRTPLNMKQINEVQIGNLTRRKITYQAEPGSEVSAYLILPDATKEKVSAVLCLHQTTWDGKDEPAGAGGDPSLHYALHLAERGYVTLAPDYPSFGESKWDFDPSHGYQSGTMKAIWDNIRAVDLLEHLPEVDASRIGCIGHSLGGHNAMFTAAFDQRLKVIVSSCGFTRFHKDDMPSWTGRPYMPRIASLYHNDANQVPFDFPEVIGAFAPRPFLACAAIKDADFDVNGVAEAMTSAKAVYELYGKSDCLQAYYPDSQHGFPQDARDNAFDFLDRYLKPGSQ